MGSLWLRNLMHPRSLMQAASASAAAHTAAAAPRGSISRRLATSTRASQPSAGVSLSALYVLTGYATPCGLTCVLFEAHCSSPAYAAWQLWPAFGGCHSFLGLDSLHRTANGTARMTRRTRAQPMCCTCPPRVITELVRSQQAEKKKGQPVHVPYRDSRLTFLLQVGTPCMR